VGFTPPFYRRHAYALTTAGIGVPLLLVAGLPLYRRARVLLGTRFAQSRTIT
jgi:hypothetical protein